MKKDKESVLIQKTKIINAATFLFYDNGYKNTSLEQIAKMCGITKPLISYYFGSKARLAWAVKDNYSRTNFDTISYKTRDSVKHYENDSHELITAIAIRLAEKYYYSDEKAKRFIVECSDDKFSAMFNPERANHFLDKRYKLNIKDKNEIPIIVRAIDGGSFAVRIAFLNGEFSCTFDEYIEFYLSLYFKLLNYPPETIAFLLEKSREILKETEFAFLPYFKII